MQLSACKIGKQSSELLMRQRTVKTTKLCSQALLMSITQPRSGATSGDEFVLQ